MVQQSIGRGSFVSEYPWSTEYIVFLPSEIQSELRKWEIASGDTSTAGHYFAVILQSTERGSSLSISKTSDARASTHYAAAANACTKSARRRIVAAIGYCACTHGVCG